MKKKIRLKSKTIPFKNNKGEIIRLPKEMTMEDCVLLGIKVKLVSGGVPLKDGWWMDA